MTIRPPRPATSLAAELAEPRLSQRGHDCADLQSLQRFQLRFGGIAALLRC